MRRRTRPSRPFLLAIDPSLRSTGVAWRKVSGHIETFRIKEPTLSGVERLAKLEERLLDVLGEIRPVAVIYEDYAMNARGRNFDIGELGGVYRSAIWRAGILRIDITPSTLKMVFTAKGNADKAKMKQTLHEVHGLDHITHNDEVDAAALLMVGEAFYFNQGNRFLISRLDQALGKEKPGIYREEGRQI